MNASMKLGEHYAIDLSDCNKGILWDNDWTFRLFIQSVQAHGLTIVEKKLHEPGSSGCNIFLLFSEGHASLYAWPEYNYCAIDFFTSKPDQRSTGLFMSIAEALEANVINIQKLDRGASIKPDDASIYLRGLAPRKM